MLRISVDKHTILKQVELVDAADVFRAINTQRDYLREWLPFVDETRSIKDSVDFIQSIYQAEDGKQELVFVIHYEGKFAGMIGFKDTNYQTLKTEIGYWLSENFQKKGIVTESVKKLVDFAFNKLELKKVQIRCACGNIASKNIPIRLNFQLEGIERDGELLSDGKYTDLEIYSLIKRDLISAD